MNKFLKAAASLLFGLLFSATPALAVDKIIGNLPPTNDSTQSLIGSSSNIKAMAFTMGGTDYALDSVVLRLGGYDAGESPLVEIRNDTGGSDPGGTVLVSFTNPASQGTDNFDYSFTPTAAFTLQNDTKYWLFVSTTSGSYNFRASSPGITPTGVASFTGNRFSNNGGTSYTNSSILNSFQINGTVVPEPSTVILAGLSVAAIAASSISRRRKS